MNNHTISINVGSADDAMKAIVSAYDTDEKINFLERSNGSLGTIKYFLNDPEPAVRKAVVKHCLNNAYNDILYIDILDDFAHNDEDKNVRAAAKRALNKVNGKSKSLERD